MKKSTNELITALYEHLSHDELQFVNPHYNL